MSTNYPGGLDTYTVKQDGVDTVAAAHINNLQDAVTAIETELGTNPKGGFTNVAAALAAKLSTTGGTLTGNLACSAGVTVDGVDVSVHDHSGGSNGIMIPDLTNAHENETTLLANLARRGADWTANSVNSSAVGSEGFPSFISSGTGLSISVNGSSVPVKMDIDGYYQQITSSVALSDLDASSIVFIYAEKSSSLTPTLGKTTLRPVYSCIAPASPASGQHWYDITTGKMKLWNGTAWELKQRIFIAEVETDASAVTDILTYSLKGRYVSQWFAVSANTQYEQDHIIGSVPLEITLFGATSEEGENCHKVGYYHNGTSGYGGMVWGIDETLLVINDASNFDYPIRYGATTSATSGYYRFIAKRGW